MSISKVQFDGNDLINLENDTVTAATLATGITAHDANGDIITGTMTQGTFIDVSSTAPTSSQGSDGDMMIVISES